MKLDFFELQEYSDKNTEHRTVIIELFNDKSSKQYLGNLSYSIDRINERKQQNELNYAFIAYRKDIPIGYISITTKGQNHEISYGIRPKYRGENLGMLLLQDFTDHIFLKYKNINELCLIINKTNTYSKNTAILAGYDEIGENKILKVKVNYLINENKINYRK